MRQGSFAHRPCYRVEPQFSIGLFDLISLAIYRSGVPTSAHYFLAALPVVFPILSRRFIQANQPFFLFRICPFPFLRPAFPQEARRMPHSRQLVI